MDGGSKVIILTCCRYTISNHNNCGGCCDSLLFRIIKPFATLPHTEYYSQQINELLFAPIAANDNLQSLDSCPPPFTVLYIMCSLNYNRIVHDICTCRQLKIIVNKVIPQHALLCYAILIISHFRSLLTNGQWGGHQAAAAVGRVASVASSLLMLSKRTYDQNLHLQKKKLPGH